MHTYKFETNLDYVLGHGSFGNLYAGTYRIQPNTADGQNRNRESDIVVKLIPKDYVPAKNQAARKDFKGPELSHPNVVKVLKILEDETYFYIFSEKENVNLSKFLESSQLKPLPEKSVRYVAHQIAGGLAYLHKNRVVLRDLNLLNIVFHFDGNADIFRTTFKICDHGE